MKEIDKELNKLKARLLPLNYKLLRVTDVSWANALTKEVQEIESVWFLGFKSSERPLLITGFEIRKKNGERYIYNITDRYYHTNLSYSIYEKEINLKNGDVATLKGLEFCNPITALHILEGNDEDMKNLLRVTLLSQNFDDSYSEVTSVSNTEEDKAVASGGYGWILPTSSPIELILGMTSVQLRKLDGIEFNEQLRNITSIGENHIYAKKKSEDRYRKFSKEHYEYHKDEFSVHYPVFDKEFIDGMGIEIPKDYYDLGVFGLGSAGTAILDQLCRSNWLSTIFLCDFDHVEAKNMINQWYTNDQIADSKVTASKSNIDKLARSMEHGISTKFTVQTNYGKFQDTIFDIRQFKYIVSGFDSCQTRQEFLQYIQEGKIEADYLIDCRYLDLACSVYFIDLKNPEEINFYKANLDMDTELINRRNSEFALNEKEFDEWVERKGYYKSNCASLREKLHGSYENCEPQDAGYGCRCDKCKEFLYELYQKSLPNSWISVSDASCVKYNYIDIYKYVGAIVFGAVREIENGAKKPFTLIEAQTGKIPQYMLVKE